METNKVKRCYKCGRVLPIEQFYKNRSMPDGLQTACKDCIKERDKERSNRRKATKIEKFTSRELMEELARVFSDMYKDHKEWLILYQQCFIAYREYMKGNESAFCVCCFYDTEASRFTPSFLDSSFCRQHARRLFTKNLAHYPQFAEYGKSDINYYYVNGELLKYKDGKRII